MPGSMEIDVAPLILHVSVTVCPGLNGFGFALKLAICGKATPLTMTVAVEIVVPAVLLAVRM
jgi:hypothetical protein